MPHPILKLSRDLPMETNARTQSSPFPSSKAPPRGIADPHCLSHQRGEDGAEGSLNRQVRVRQPLTEGACWPSDFHHQTAKAACPECVYLLTQKKNISGVGKCRWVQRARIMELITPRGFLQGRGTNSKCCVSPELIIEQNVKRANGFPPWESIPWQLKAILAFHKP